MTERLGWKIKGWREAVALRLAPWLNSSTYKAGYLAGLHMAAAAIPGDADQPALRAIDDVIATVKGQDGSDD